MRHHFNTGALMLYTVAGYYEKRERMRRKLKGEPSDEESQPSEEEDLVTSENDKLLPKKTAPIHVGADSKRD